MESWHEDEFVSFMLKKRLREVATRLTNHRIVTSPHRNIKKLQHQKITTPLAFFPLSISAKACSSWSSG